MDLLLTYIYTGQVKDFSKVSVVDLFKAADRYRLDDLKHVCEEELIERVEASNAADILSLAHKYNAQPLKTFSLAMISRNVEEVITWCFFFNSFTFLAVFSKMKVHWKK